MAASPARGSTAWALRCELHGLVTTLPTILGSHVPDLMIDFMATIFDDEDTISVHRPKPTADTEGAVWDEYVSLLDGGLQTASAREKLMQARNAHKLIDDSIAAMNRMEIGPVQNDEAHRSLPRSSPTEASGLFSCLVCKRIMFPAAVAGHKAVCRGPPKQPKPSPVKVVAKRSSAGGAAGGNSSSRGRGKGRGRGRGRGRAARPPPGKSKLSIGGKAGPQAAIDINQATAQAYATSQRQAMNGLIPSAEESHAPQFLEAALEDAEPVLLPVEEPPPMSQNGVPVPGLRRQRSSTIRKRRSAASLQNMLPPPPAPAWSHDLCHTAVSHKAAEWRCKTSSDHLPKRQKLSPELQSSVSASPSRQSCARQLQHRRQQLRPTQQQQRQQSLSAFQTTGQPKQLTMHQQHQQALARQQLQDETANGCMPHGLQSQPTHLPQYMQQLCGTHQLPPSHSRQTQASIPLPATQPIVQGGLLQGSQTTSSQAVWDAKTPAQQMQIKQQIRQRQGNLVEARRAAQRAGMGVLPTYGVGASVSASGPSSLAAASQLSAAQLHRLQQMQQLHLQQQQQQRQAQERYHPALRTSHLESQRQQQQQRQIQQSQQAKRQPKYLTTNQQQAASQNSPATAHRHTSGQPPPPLQTAARRGASSPYAPPSMAHSGQRTLLGKSPVQRAPVRLRIAAMLTGSQRDKDSAARCLPYCRVPAAVAAAAAGARLTPPAGSRPVQATLVTAGGLPSTATVAGSRSAAGRLVCAETPAPLRQYTYLVD